jgi:cell division protein FtsL
VRKRRGTLLGSRFAATLLFFLAVSVAFLYVWERVSAVELTIRIERLRDEVMSVQNEVKRLEIRKSELSSHQRIERIAREDLGLKHPTPHETVIVMPDSRTVRLTELKDAQGKD